jgi:hypothetical protein
VRSANGKGCSLGVCVSGGAYQPESAIPVIREADQWIKSGAVG